MTKEKELEDGFKLRFGALKEFIEKSGGKGVFFVVAMTDEGLGASALEMTTKDLTTVQMFTSSLEEHVGRAINELFGPYAPKVLAVFSSKLLGSLKKDILERKES